MKRVILLLLTFSLMGCVAKASSDPNPALYQVGLAQYWILDSIQLARTGNLQASQAWQVSHLAQAQTRLALAEAALTGLNDCNWPDPCGGQTQAITNANYFLEEAARYLGYNNPNQYNAPFDQRALSAVRAAQTDVSGLSLPLNIPSVSDQAIIGNLILGMYWTSQSEIQFLTDVAANIAADGQNFYQMDTVPYSDMGGAILVLARVPCDNMVVLCAIGQYSTQTAPALYEAVNRLILDPTHDQFADHGVPYYFRTGMESLMEAGGPMNATQNIALGYVLRAWQASDAAAWLVMESIH